MSEIFRNSFICRGVIYVARTLHAWWQEGALAKCIELLRHRYEASSCRRFWLTFGAKPGFMDKSFYFWVMNGLRRLLETVGTWLEQSLFFRGMRALKNGYLHLSAHSRVLSLINRLSLRQWLLVAFGFYLPLEFIIRDTLAVPVLSSIWEELFLIGAAILIVWRRSLRQTEAIRRETPLDAWLLLFFAVGFFLMSVVRPYPEVALPGYRIVVEYLLWFFLIIRLVEDEKDLRTIYVSLLLMSGFLALHGIYQYIAGVEIPESWVSQTEMGVRTRVFSLTGSPNILGSLLVLTTPLWAALIYFCKQIWLKVLAFGITGCAILALLFTFSRGAWIGMIVAVVIFSFLVDKRLLALMGVGIAGVLVAVPSITSRLTYLFTSDYAEASAIGGRALRWELGRELLYEHNPWLGFGLGRFGGAVAMQNQLLNETDEFSYFYMDNYYLKTMVEMGYLGLIVYLLLLIALLVLGLRAIQRSDNPFAGNSGDPLIRAEGNYRILAIAIYAGLCGVLVHCFFENIFEEPYMSAYFWGLAAILFYLGYFQKRRDSA
jgi:O-antigen ligase